MKKNSASNYDRNMALENLLAILFSVVVTLLVILGKDEIIALSEKISLMP